MQLCQLFCDLVRSDVKKPAEGNIWDSTETQNNSCEITWRSVSNCFQNHHCSQELWNVGPSRSLADFPMLGF